MDNAMQDSIFREYDIRGRVGKELCVKQVYDFAQAFATYARQRNAHITTIAVGMDGRLHSLEIKKELCQGLIDSGLDVVFIGQCTSPALYFALHAQPFSITCDAGIMITASHNPKEYNGFKLCLGAESVWGKEIARIRDIFKARNWQKQQKRGAYTECLIVELYVSWLADAFSHLKGMDVPVVVDCGNGAAGTVLPALREKCAWSNMTLLYSEVDGNYPHHEADPTVERNMRDLKAYLAQGDFACGIGLDGDCDRMAPMTADGFLVPGDQLLGVFARHLDERYKTTPVVFDVKASLGLVELLEKEGIPSVMSQTGHALIKMNMKKHNAVLGGELSCHFVFGDRYFGYDDGVYAMLRLFEIMLQTKQTLPELLARFPKKVTSPELRITCNEHDKAAIITAIKEWFTDNEDATLCQIDGVRVQLPHGWGLARSSNTQPKIGLRFEADSDRELYAIKHLFYQAMEPFFDKQFLKGQFEL